MKRLLSVAALTVGMLFAQSTIMESLDGPVKISVQQLPENFFSWFPQVRTVVSVWDTSPSTTRYVVTVEYRSDGHQLQKTYDIPKVVTPCSLLLLWEDTADIVQITARAVKDTGFVSVINRPIQK